MNQSEALNLAIEMLEEVAPGSHLNNNDFYEKLRGIKAAILGANPEQSAARSYHSPRTAIIAGEEFREIDRETIAGRDLLLMVSCRDGSEAPFAIVDAETNEVVMDEVYDGFKDYRDEEALAH